MSSATLKIDIPEDGPPVTNTGGSGNQKIHANLCRQPRNKATIVAGAFRVANKFCRIIYIYILHNARKADVPLAPPKQIFRGLRVPVTSRLGAVSESFMATKEVAFRGDTIDDTIEESRWSRRRST